MKRQFLVIASSRLIAAAIQALVGIGLARAIGPSSYGEITAFTGVLIFLFIVCGLGIPSYLSRARALQQHDVVATALFLNVAGSLFGIAVVLVPLLGGMLSLTSGPVLALVVIGTALDKNADAALAVPIADGDPFSPAVNVLLRRLLTAAVFFGMLALGRDPILAYCVGTAAGPAVGQAHVYLVLNRRGVDRAHRASIWEVVRNAIPFGINDIAVQSKSLVVVLVAAATNPFTAGLFSAASKLIAPTELAASTLGGIMLPRASVMTAQQQRSTAWKLTLLAAAMLPGAALLAAFAEPVVVFLLGEEFRGAATTFALLSMTLPLLVLSSPTAALLQGMHRERLVGLSSVAIAILLPLAVFIGALYGGATGAAIGMLAATAAKSLWLVTAAVVLAGRDGRPRADRTD